MDWKEYRRKKKLYKATIGSVVYSVGFGFFALISHLLLPSYNELWIMCMIGSIISIIVFVILLLVQLTQNKRE